MSVIDPTSVVGNPLGTAAIGGHAAVPPAGKAMGYALRLSAQLGLLIRRPGRLRAEKSERAEKSGDPG
jgi:hypothetical protein